MGGTGLEGMCAGEGRVETRQDNRIAGLCLFLPLPMLGPGLDNDDPRQESGSRNSLKACCMRARGIKREKGERAQAKSSQSRQVVCGLYDGGGGNGEFRGAWGVGRFF